MSVGSRKLSICLVALHLSMATVHLQPRKIARPAEAGPGGPTPLMIQLRVSRTAAVRMEAAHPGVGRPPGVARAVYEGVGL